jgi:hypothetical protein
MGNPHVLLTLHLSAQGPSALAKVTDWAQLDFNILDSLLLDGAVYLGPDAHSGPVGDGWDLGKDGGKDGVVGYT